MSKFDIEFIFKRIHLRKARSLINNIEIIQSKSFGNQEHLLQVQTLSPKDRINKCLILLASSEQEALVFLFGSDSKILRAIVITTKKSDMSFISNYNKSFENLFDNTVNLISKSLELSSKETLLNEKVFADSIFTEAQAILEEYNLIKLDPSPTLEKLVEMRDDLKDKFDIRDDEDLKEEIEKNMKDIVKAFSLNKIK